MDAITFKSRVEQGKAIRRSVFQPVTSLVRQEDLAFCASRILMCVPLIQSEDAGLAKWIEDTLGDMAAIQPEDALEKVKKAAGTYSSKPIYWVTTCHILSQTLSEFSHEATAQTITELRQALPNWFPRFQDTIKSLQSPLDNVTCLAFQAYFAQTAIFKDQEAYRWAQEKMLTFVTEDTLDSRHLQEMTALVGGSFDSKEDEGQCIQLLQKLEEVSEYNESARLIQDAIGGPSLSELSLKIPGRKKKKEKKRTEGQGKIASLLESIGETVGWALPVLGVILVGGFCLWGFGKFYDYFGSSSHVGQTNLDDWYENAEERNRRAKEAKEKNESGEATESEEISPEDIEIIEVPATPEPAEKTVLLDEQQAEELESEELEIETVLPEESAAPPPSLPVQSPEEEPVSNANLPKAPALQWFNREDLPQDLIKQINEDRQNMVPRLKISRRDQAGHPTYARLAGLPLVHHTPEKSIVRYPIDWYVSDRIFTGQFIEAHYNIDVNDGWIVEKAARLTFPNGTGGGSVYRDSPQELMWAKGLFIPNPFYTEVSFK